MVAIEHRQKPTVSATSSTATTSSVNNQQQSGHTASADVIEMAQQQTEQEQLTASNTISVCEFSKMSEDDSDSCELTAKSAASQRNVDIKLSKQSEGDNATKELTKKVLKLDITGRDVDENSLKSPKSPISARIPHQTTLTSVDVEDRKTLREHLYQGIFHRHRRTIFAVGSFLRMLRSRNSQYNTIRSSSEAEEEVKSEEAR